MSVIDKDGVIVLGNDSVTPANNITIKTPAVADGSLEIYRGVPGALDQEIAKFSNDGLSISALNGGQLAGFRNKILNGRFNINQAGAASRTAAIGYNYDQWYYDGTYLYQPVPTEDVYNGTYTLSWEGNSTAAWSLNALGSSAQNAQTYTPVAKGGQIIVSGHTNEHLWVRFATDLGNLNKVQLEPGDRATSYEDRYYQQDLRLCQYFVQIITMTLVTGGFVQDYTFNSMRNAPTLVLLYSTHSGGGVFAPRNNTARQFSYASIAGTSDYLLSARI